MKTLTPPLMRIASRHPSGSAHGRINTIVGQMITRVSGRFSTSEAWSPPINIYQLTGQLEICVDLAGVQRSKIDVNVKPGCLIIRGVRRAPDPPDHQRDPMKIITMEIDHGPFCREVKLPENIDLKQVDSEYRDGMLWIILPFKVNDRSSSEHG